jgi:murein DD-endopeptidase MepM/ murein hydrolase activator NlpD
VFEGVIAEVVTDEGASDFGHHAVVEHIWPANGGRFFTLYAHLSEVFVAHASPIPRGGKIGRMGQTSRSADARRWMTIAPHLHFVVQSENGQSYNPSEFLGAFLR